ncbi:unnamed protein product [Closterium sp. NIES-54]
MSGLLMLVGSAVAARARVAGVVEVAPGVVVGAAMEVLGLVEVVAAVGVVARVGALVAAVVAAVGVAVVAAVGEMAVGVELFRGEVLAVARGIEAAALVASESALPGTAPAAALRTFTLDSGASRCFFCESTTLTPLSSPVPVRLADPLGGPVLARSSTVLPCPARTAPHSSSFPPTTAPLQTLHMDVWSPARVSGQGRERYFLLVVDDYTRYTTVFPLHNKGEVPVVLIPWIRVVRLQLRERFCQVLPVLCLHSDRGGEFSSDLLSDFCRGKGILQSFTLPAYPQQNGIVERRIGLVMEVARTSMMHAAAPHFLLPFVVRYAAHQLNLWPRVSLPETSPTGKVRDASVFRDVTFDELVPFYRLFPYCSAPLPPPPLFLAPGPSPGAECEGAGSGGAEPGGAEPWGAEPTGAEPGGAELEGAVPRGAEFEGAESGSAEPRGTASSGGSTAGDARAGGVGAACRGGVRTRGNGAAGADGVGGTGAGGAGAGDTVAGGNGSAGVIDPGAGGTGAGGAVSRERREPGSRPASPVCAVCTGRRVPRPHPPPVPGTHIMALRPSSVPLGVPVPPPPESSLLAIPDTESDLARAASPTVSPLLATAVTDPSFESTAASALVAELVEFAAVYRLDYATALIADSKSKCPPSVGGECALGIDVHEDTQEDFECLAAAVTHLVTMLLAPEGDPDAPDIPTPRSYAEAITGPYSSQWQTAMDAEMASWKSIGAYVDTVPLYRANIVDGMWIFRVKRQPGSPPAFKARYVARGFSQRQGVDFFQTFSPTPKMTTLWVLLHVAAQRDYELHSLDFSIAFLQGSLHEEIWLRRPPGFTGSFPPGTQWSIRRPVYGLRQAPRKWHDTLRTMLAAPGFAPSTADPSLFLRTDTSLPPFYVVRRRLGLCHC